MFKAVFIPRNLDDVDDYEKDILKVQEGQTDEVRHKKQIRKVKIPSILWSVWKRAPPSQVYFFKVHIKQDEGAIVRGWVIFEECDPLPFRNRFYWFFHED